MEMTKREFFQQYVLNAARGAGRYQLNVEGALREASTAWDAIEKGTPSVPPDSQAKT